MTKPPILRAALAAAVVAAAYPLGDACAGEPMSAAENFSDTPAGRLVAADPVRIIGHRGAARHRPENTLASFQAALDAGADVVELDYRVTRDGHPVAFHDKELDRTTNAEQVLGRAKLSVGDVTLEQLQQLDAGSWFHPRFRGEKAPTLAESLDLIQKTRVTMIERKAGGAAACVKLLREKEMLDQVVVQAFDWDYIAEFRRLAPTAVLGALGKDELTEEKLDAIERTGAQLVGWNEKDITKDGIDAVHARGMKVWLYTVNSPRRAQELIAAGADGIITDDPQTMVVLRNRLQR